jgi:hypothetical protein
LKKPFQTLTSEEKKELHMENETLARAYKVASPAVKQAILRRYFEANESFVTSCWRKWRREFWPELTQIFVSKWHEAFENYAPETDESIFNCYMDRKYKWATSEELKKWLKREALHEELAPALPDGSVLERPELSTWADELNKAVVALYTTLASGLDKQELVVLNEHFFGDKPLGEIIREAPAKWRGSVKGNPTPGTLSFKERYDWLIEKWQDRVSQQYLWDICQLRDNDRRETVVLKGKVG